MEETTPMLRQYLEIKKQYPGTLLMFRLGDFYELFNEDALTGSRELQITLTARQKDSKNPIPMCGVPHHAAAGYIAKLVRKGYRVAICEQAEAASRGTKLVRREVVRVITPGTAIDEQLMEAGTASYLASVSEVGGSVGIALLELSTGEFLATEFSTADRWRRLKELISGYSPREILFPASLKVKAAREFAGVSGQTEPGLPAVDGLPPSPENTEYSLTQLPDADFDVRDSEELLCAQFAVRELTAYNLAGHSAAIAAAGACLSYAQFTQKAAADHITSIKFLDTSEFLVLDQLTLRTLDILADRADGPAKRSLLAVINETVTGMGSRLLNSWIVRPLLRRKEIETRQAAVEQLLEPMLRDSIRHLMRSVADLERIVGRLNLGTATARDLLGLAATLEKTPLIADSISDSSSLLLQVLSENIAPLPELRTLIRDAIEDDPPANINDGGTIRTGFNAELDDLRSLSSDTKRSIAKFEEQERSRTGIPTLKTKFNNVFGYFIEVSKTHAPRVPDDYQRRQTLANAERFTTPQLKEWESKVLGAESRMIELEAEIFQELKDKAKAETFTLQTTARALATLDVLAALAETATRRDYVRPTLHDGDEIEIRKGRHPVVEVALRGSFIPNDLYLNNSTDRLLIVTGANMGGKSTVLRQAALIQILAQIGSFVPATSARLPIVDRIWTRVGASDDLASGRSTFMVEMTETASILNNATPRSLILLDEIGRGTSTFDGLSIAWAVAEYLHNSPEHAAKTIFATHYHELTELAESLPGARNYQMAATENEDDVVFLHKLEAGTAKRSYGIAVARLAGLPPQVLDRANEVLARLEKYELAVFADDRDEPVGLAAAAGRGFAAQTSLFSLANDDALATLRTADPDAMTPEQAIEFLKDLKTKIA